MVSQRTTAVSSDGRRPGNMRFDFEIDGDVQVSRKLLRFGQSAQDARPAFNSMIDQIISLTKRQFDTQGVSGSGGWDPLKPQTIAAKLRKNQDPRILRASGNLFESLTSLGAKGQRRIVEPGFMVFGSDLPYSGVHQKGSPGKNIPQRRPIELTRQNRKQLVKTLQRYIMTGQVA